MNLDLRSLLHFATVADSGSFTAAAKRLGIAQPWLSQRIRALESRLGFPLFIREGRSIQLTAEGRQLYSLASRLPRLAQEIEGLADQLSSTSRRSLRIGAPPYASRISMVNDLLAELGTLYRDANISLDVGWSSHLVERVRNRELDACFALSPFDASGLECIEVGQLYRLFVLSGDNATGDACITPEALRNRAVAAFPRTVNPALYDLAFTSLIQAGVELIPVAFDGRPMRSHGNPGELVTSYFGIPEPASRPEEKRLAGAPPIPLHFVTHGEAGLSLVRAARTILLRQPGARAAREGNATPALAGH